MTKHKKIWILCFLGVAVAAMVLLSAGLSDLEFLPGQPFFLATGSPQSVLEPLPGGESLMTLVRGVVALALICAPFLIVYFVVSPEFRKRVLRVFISLLWIYALGIVFARLRLDFAQIDEGIRLGPSPGQELGPVPVANFVNDPPQWLAVVTTILLSVILGGLLVGAIWYFRRLAHRSSPAPLEQLAQPVLDALESLQAGGDLRNIVMRCYFEMVRVLDTQRGIQRQMDMTPREFERCLEEVGLSGEPVWQLTRLFEAVRYGAKDVGEDEERRAIACLTDIVEACRSLP
jgi:hypothetical protein